MEFDDSQTKQNLAKAFALLSQQNSKYNFMSKLAKQDGFYYICQILKNFAKQKLGQAKKVYDILLENIKKTNDNINIETSFPFEKNQLQKSLLNSAEIEEYEGKNLFLQFKKVAEDEGFSIIANIFQLISNISIENYKILKILSENYNTKKLYNNNKPVKWICSNCGYQAISKQVWKNCPLCEQPKGYVVLPEEKFVQS